MFNLKYALLRSKLASNQKLRQLIFCNHSDATAKPAHSMLPEFKSLIYCNLTSHYES